MELLEIEENKTPQLLTVSKRQTTDLCNFDIKCKKLAVWITTAGCIISLLCLASLLFFDYKMFISESHTEMITALNEINNTAERNGNYTEDTLSRSYFDCPVTLSGFNRSKKNLHTIKCGGLISLPTNGTSVWLEYKSGQMYDANESCVWILDTTHANERFEVKLKVTVECEGFADPDDTLSLIEWEEWESLHYELLTKAKSYESPKPSDWLYLGFFTNGAVNGKGFIIRLEATKKDSGYFRGSNHVFKRSPGTFRYKPNRNIDRVAVVINPSPRVEPNVYVNRSIDLKAIVGLNSNGKNDCQEEDTIYIFLVGLHTKEVNSKLCRSFSNLTIKTELPILVGYLTSDSASGAMFIITWK